MKNTYAEVVGSRAQQLVIIGLGIVASPACGRLSFDPATDGRTAAGDGTSTGDGIDLDAVAACPGATWRTVTTGGGSDYNWFVSGTSSNDVWIVGSAGRASHWDGTAWQARNYVANPLPDLRSVWTIGTRTWVVGDRGTILEWNGSGWTPGPNLTNDILYSVRGRAADDLWITGQNGTVIRGTSTGWSLVQSGTTLTLKALYISDSGDTWAVGMGGIALRWNGSMWNPVSTGIVDDLLAIWADGGSALWTVSAGGHVASWDGTQWLPPQMITTDRLEGIGGTATSVYLVGVRAALYTKVGDTWVAESSEWTGQNQNFHSVWAADPCNVWAVGTTGIVMRRSP